MLLAGVLSRGDSKETGNSLQRSSPNPTELRQPPASLQLPESSFVSFESCPGFLVERGRIFEEGNYCILAEPDVS